MKIKKLTESSNNVYPAEIESSLQQVVEVLNNLSGITPNKEIGVKVVRRKTGPVITATYVFRNAGYPSKSSGSDIDQSISNSEAFTSISGEEVNFESYQHKPVTELLVSLIKSACEGVNVDVKTSVWGLSGIELAVDVKVDVLQ